MATEASESKVTTDHDEIRRWVEERGGHPARVKDTESKNSPGLLRIDYPGFSGGDSL
jgi:transposase-like protein